MTRTGTLEEYEQDYAAMTLLHDWAGRISTAAAKIIEARARYMPAGELSGVPWQLIGVLHSLESGGSFAGVLHNGERIIGTGRKTSLVPAGRGPFASWEAAAADALAIKRQNMPQLMDGIRSWTVGEILLYAERFNGGGYLRRGKRSPYLFSGSDLGVGVGKYVADGRYDPAAVSQQIGAAVILCALEGLGYFTPVYQSGNAPPIYAYGPGVARRECEDYQRWLFDRGLYHGSFDGRLGPLSSDAHRRAWGDYLRGDPRREDD